MRGHVVFACLLLALSAGIVDVKASDKLQPIPPLSGPVVDLTNTLSASQQQQLAQKLLSLQEKYGAQMQVLVIPSSAPEDAFSYSMRVVEKWKLGTAEKDDGLLLFVAKDDRRSQIQVGYGLEGVIPDVVASRLQSDVMAPYFKQGDFYGGINAVIDGVYARVSGDASLAPALPDNSSGGMVDEQGLNVLFAIILGIIVIKLLKFFLGGLGGSLLGAPLTFIVIWWLVGLSLLAAVGVAWLVLLLAWLPNEVWFALLSRRYGGGYGGGLGGGGWSGGGGGFGGGGAGGRW